MQPLHEWTSSKICSPGSSSVVTAPSSSSRLKIPEDVSKNISDFHKNSADMRAAKAALSFNIELEIADPHPPRIQQACAQLQEDASRMHATQQQLMRQLYLDAAYQESLSQQLTLCRHLLHGDAEAPDGAPLALPRQISEMQAHTLSLEERVAELRQRLCVADLLQRVRDAGELGAYLDRMEQLSRDVGA
eukprot:gene42613-52068_t